MTDMHIGSITTMTLLQRVFAAVSLWLCLAVVPPPGHARALDFLPPPDPDDGVTFRVLCLHDVRDNLRATFETLPDAFAIDTRTLVDIFEWLRANDYHPVSLDQIVAARNGGPPLPARPLLLTFDDGYESTYSKVFPLLKRFNYPAVVSLVTQWTETPPGTIIDLGPRLKVPRDYFMDWDQIREMADSGLVEFATHTHNMHQGGQANPQGNELPLAATRIYDPQTGQYEDDQAYAERVRADLARSIELIREHTGQTVRAVAWPYGAHNRDLDTAARELGLTVMLTLEPGPNSPDVPLERIRRSLASYEITVAMLRAALREPMSYHGQVHPVQRVVQVDLDYVYDKDPEQQERNLSMLIDRMKDLAPSAVYLQAFADPKGDGDVTELYFPNRHLPMRADLFSRVAWQLKTRANTQVYAWLPVLSYHLPADNPVSKLLVQSVRPAEEGRGLGHPIRLSPFHPQTRKLISEIYEDLAKHAAFDGLLFHDDAVLDDTEDGRPEALAVYASWGLPPNIAKIRADPKMAMRWSRGKTRYLIDFTRELGAMVQDYQNGIDMLTVRNLYSQPVLDPAAEAWYAQNLEDFLANYDYVALMAMPHMESADDPNDWLRKLVAEVAHKKGLATTIFELQSVDWRTRTPIPSATLRDQMALLRSLGAIHYGYYPDDFIEDRPNTEIIREVMSLKTTLEKRVLPSRLTFGHQSRLQGAVPGRLQR